MLADQAYHDKLQARIAEIEARLSLPQVAANNREFRSLMSEHARLKNLEGRTAEYLRLLRALEESRALIEGGDSDAELIAMAKTEIGEVEARLPDAEKELLFAMVPPDPADSRNTILEIRAGTGGEEAALFAGDLYRMYARFAETRGWKVDLIDASPSTIGGFKEVVFSVEGENVYRTLRYESGGHRVQRVPVTEASGRIHTSAATVAVLPEAEEIDAIEIKPEDLRIDLYRASGPGGQKVNKTESAVRLTHLPTGIVVQCQDEKSQHRNRDKAMRVLSARILDRMRQEEHDRMAGERRMQIGSGDRSERIRTYNFPQNRITDHRINLTLYSLDRIMEGEIAPLVDALREQDMQLRVKVQIGA